MQKQPSIRDIATAVGVHYTTVARALGNRPGVSAKKKEMIIAEAEKMGYRRNALVSAWMANRRAANPVRKHASIGVVLYDLSKNRTNAAFLATHRAYVRQAEALGYRVELFGCKDCGGWERLAKILSTRGIQGVILHGIVEESGVIGKALSGFSSVAFGGEVKGVLTIRSHAHAGMLLMLEQLKAKGFKRPGCLFFRRPTMVDIVAYECAYARAFLRQDFAGEAVMRFAEPASVESQLEIIMGKHRCDVLIDNGIKNYASPIPVASLSARPGKVMGIDQNRKRLAEIAIEQVVARINRSAYGTEKRQETILVDGQWVEARG